MESRLDDLPVVDADMYQGAVSSITALSPLCKDIEGHEFFQRVLQDCIEVVGVDSRNGR
jgi:hypothetical protein